MSVKRPYFLTVRQFADGMYNTGGRWMYIQDGRFSHNPSNYVRSYLLLQKDLMDLFNYIEPCDTNLKTYSFRIHELFIRTCLELEANFKAILALNKYKKKKNLNLEDYYKVNSSHYLSSYAVKVPYWREKPMTAVRQPFVGWGKPKDRKHPWILEWYQDYNKTKHDRANSLNLANFENLLDAFSGLVVLITAQYLFEDFSPGNVLLAASSGIADGFVPATGDNFRIHLPSSTPATERYDFDWQILKKDASPFQKFDYDKV